MDARLGWALAVAAVALGHVQYGWQGVALAMSGTVFWLLLQFTRALRAMRVAGSSPVGTVASAVMLQARLKKGMRLMDVILMTRSLGQRPEGADQPADPAAGAGGSGTPAAECFRWTDASGATVTVNLVRGRVTDWALGRPAEAPGSDAAPPPAPGT